MEKHDIYESRFCLINNRQVYTALVSQNNNVVFSYCVHGAYHINKDGKNICGSKKESIAHGMMERPKNICKKCLKKIGYF